MINYGHVCILGDSNVGKTTSILTLKEQKYTPSELATLGIQVYQYNRKGSNNLNSESTSLIVNSFTLLTHLI